MTLSERIVQSLRPRTLALARKIWTESKNNASDSSPDWTRLLDSVNSGTVTEGDKSQADTGDIKGKERVPVSPFAWKDSGSPEFALSLSRRLFEVAQRHSSPSPASPSRPTRQDQRRELAGNIDEQQHSEHEPRPPSATLLSTCDESDPVKRSPHQTHLALYPTQQAAPLEQLRYWIRATERRRIRINKIYVLMQRLRPERDGSYGFLHDLGEADSHRLFDLFDRKTTTTTRARDLAFLRTDVLEGMVTAMLSLGWELTAGEERALWLSYVREGRLWLAKRCFDKVSDPLELIKASPKPTDTCGNRTAREIYYQACSFRYWNAFTSALLAKLAAVNRETAGDGRRTDEELWGLFKAWYQRWRDSYKQLQERCTLSSESGWSMPAVGDSPRERQRYKAGKRIWVPNQAGRFPHHLRCMTLRPYALNAFLHYLVSVRGQISLAIHLYHIAVDECRVVPDIATFQIIITGILSSHSFHSRLYSETSRSLESLPSLQALPRSPPPSCFAVLTTDPARDGGRIIIRDPRLRKIHALIGDMHKFRVRPNTALLNSIVSIAVKHNHIRGLLDVLRVFELDWSVRPNARTMQALESLLALDKRK
ncbi:hypothetical protein EV182_001894 [Spiromyces aspiralis]|uniref:Uncharacterized protein n=1 Tax=Spiromyces aspiralis TaxID=68401 RepID=A0ACC1HG09_9FUNG|nr:hypothetical protein EV182_001894 [Spiromyces aspiralis]